MMAWTAFPIFFAALVGTGIAFFHLLPVHLMGPPVFAVIGIVQQDGLEVVQGVGVPGFRRISPVEFLKKGPEFPGLILGQQAENPVPPFSSRCRWLFTASAS